MASPGRAKALPCLPGMSCPPVPQANYAKKQTLSYKNGYAVPVELAMPSDEDLAAQLANWSIVASTSSGGAAAAAAEPFVPAFVALDKKVLRYMGWFGEAVPDSPLEAWRVRRVHLLVYLEDGSMQITEPPEPNSGLTQGTLVRRHKLPKPGGGVLRPDDLAVGGSIKIYGREVYIVDADAFTREQAAKRGVSLAPALPYPASPYEEALAAKSKPSGLSRADPDSPSKYAEALLGKEFTSKSLQQFLQHGGEVLRFFMQGRTNEGVLRKFKLHFYVCDNTAEIMEVADPAGGGPLFPTFLKRGPLPKVVRGGALPGQSRLAPEECYAPADLRIGASVTILGRAFLIYDVDAATRAWYTERLGFAPEALAPIDVSEPPRPPPQHQIPAPTGLSIGSPEDSLQNCLHLVPKPPKKDQHRWQTLDHVVFRYEAVLEPPAGRQLIKLDSDRRFVISFWLADQTLSVYEPPVPNSGISGGKFLERGRVYRQGSQLSWYTEEDVKVGAVLELHGRRFRITRADQFTEQYRAQHG